MPESQISCGPPLKCHPVCGDLPVIFGLFGNKGGGGDSDDEDDEDIELVTFQGATNGKSADMVANARLAQAGLVPTKELVTDALDRRAEQIKIEFKGERAQVTTGLLIRAANWQNHSF